MPSSLEIAQAAVLRPIEEIVAAAGLEAHEVEPYCRTKAKIDFSVLERLQEASETHLSLSHDPELINAPTGFELTVRDARAFTSAGWLVALCGTMQTMPDGGATPAAYNVDIDDESRTVGLF